MNIQSASPLNVSNGTAFGVVCSLECSCGGATLAWSRVGYQSLPSSALVVPENAGRSLTLTFSVVTVDMGGEYACTASRGTQPPANETLVVQVVS